MATLVVVGVLCFAAGMVVMAILSNLLLRDKLLIAVEDEVRIIHDDAVRDLKTWVALTRKDLAQTVSELKAKL